MKEHKSTGRYRKRKQRGRTIPVLLMLLCLSAALFGVLLYGTVITQNQFRALSEQVRTVPTEGFSPAAAQQTTAPETTAATVPPTTQPLEILPQYQALYAQNPDFFGWLAIDGTIIDYPVMHTPDDPEKYLHANFDGVYSFAGTPFADASCSLDSDNILIYAHNMLDGSMFRSLLEYERKNYWQEHPTIRFDTLYGQYEYEVLAAFYDRVYYKTETCFKFYQFIDAENEADYDNAIANFQEKALYDTGVDAEYGDKLITLVTCSYQVENGRFVVVARRK